MLRENMQRAWGLSHNNLCAISFLILQWRYYYYHHHSSPHINILHSSAWSERKRRTFCAQEICGVHGTNAMHAWYSALGAINWFSHRYSASRHALYTILLQINSSKTVHLYTQRITIFVEASAYCITLYGECILSETRAPPAAMLPHLHSLYILRDDDDLCWHAASTV